MLCERCERIFLLDLSLENIRQRPKIGWYTTFPAAFEHHWKLEDLAEAANQAKCQICTELHAIWHEEHYSDDEDLGRRGNVHVGLPGNPFTSFEIITENEDALMRENFTLFFMIKGFLGLMFSIDLAHGRIPLVLHTLLGLTALNRY